jgi:hypothetical protein
MQFVVPQFIDVEDKVIGPISVRQFITMLAGGGLIFLDYELIYRLNNNFWFFVIVAFFTGAATLVFTFIKVNGRPFHYFLLNLIATMKEPRLRIWNKTLSVGELRRQKTPLANPTSVVPARKTLTASKLALLTLVVDTGGAFRASSDETEPTIRVDRNPSL